MVFQIRRLNLSMFFQCLFHCFSALILYGLFMVLGTILAPCSIPFRPFGHHFWILFRCRLFHDFRMPFWSTLGAKSTHPTGRRNVFFCFFVFLGSRFRGCFFMIFDEFWIDFGWFLMDFSIIVGPFSHKFCKVFDVVCIRIFDAFSHPWRINFA